MKNKSTIARLKASPVIVAGLAVFVGSVLAMIAVAALMRGYAVTDQRHSQLVSELRAQAYQLTLLSREATQGSDQAFADFEKVVSGMSNTWNQLKNADPKTREQLAAQLRDYEAVWANVLRNSQTIADNRELIVSLNKVGQELNQNLPTLQAEHDNIVEVLLELKAPAEQAIQAQLLSWRSERIGRNVDTMLRGDEDASEAADQFNRDANFYSRVLTAMKNGDPILGITRVNDASARESLERITRLFEGVNASIQEMYNGSETLLKARQATVQLLIDSPKLLQSLVSIQDRINNLSTERNLDKALLALAALAMAAFFAVGAILYRQARLRADNIAETNQRHQQAIKRLLDDMSDLATGDLTTHANVDEEFTGSIADAVNYAIDQLRILVARINETAVDVSGAAKQTQQTALHLAEAAEHQAQEIVGASAAVNEMAITIDQVSTNAAESAAVAERAVSIAKNGANVVQNTIHGMDTIREQIQDTSKRIKRLGESSQEIGDIVSLINDIADQTNILALNAAIQASMAGDAGRGFAVVADEVQRLAERSAAATKQIEALVKAIQNDTNQAVTSMEQTTAEVVRGARLAQDAGVALGEIENVSDNLAALIQNISNAARQQAASAGHISNTMNVIQEITMQTASGTSATANSIGDLTALALSLRESVEGFKLPDDMAPHAHDLDYLETLAPEPLTLPERRAQSEDLALG